jgi:hypothetical protein
VTAEDEDSFGAPSGLYEGFTLCATDILPSRSLSPRGVRGIGPSRATAYGRGIEGYRHEALAQTLVCVQIETRQGVINLNEILSVSGVDLIFVGPGDLTASFMFGEPAGAAGWRCLLVSSVCRIDRVVVFLLLRPAAFGTRSRSERGSERGCVIVGARRFVFEGGA